MDAQYTLINSGNFNKSLKSSLSDLLGKYISLMLEYSKYILEKVSIKNKKYQEFIINRGLDTMSHVFSMILFYTKNVDFAYFHSHKSIFFYVEFIEQITRSSVQYLPLSSRDASIFVYKKTIYEINSAYRKTIDTDTIKDEKIELLNSCIEIYKLLFYLPVESITEISNIISNNTILHNQKSLKIIYLFIEKMKENEWTVLFATQFLNKLKTINSPKIMNQLLSQILNGELIP